MILTQFVAPRFHEILTPAPGLDCSAAVARFEFIQRSTASMLIERSPASMFAAVNRFDFIQRSTASSSTHHLLCCADYMIVVVLL